MEKTKSKYPEIYIDFNARMTENGFGLRRGTFDDLERLGLTPETALGKKFVFVSDDADDDGNSDDIMCHGTIVRDTEFEYLAVKDGTDFYWRSQLK